MSEHKEPWVGSFVALLIGVIVLTRACDPSADLPADLGDNEICQGPSQVGNDC